MAVENELEMIIARGGWFVVKGPVEALLVSSLNYKEKELAKESKNLEAKSCSPFKDIIENQYMK